MPQIRRNTEEFATVATLLHDYRKHPDRRKLILLYALKPSQKIDERILINKLKKDAAALYEMNYDSILQHLEDRAQVLYREADTALYYFKSSSSPNWLKEPFEFAGKLKRQASPLRVVR